MIHISLRSSIERATCAVYSRFTCGEQWQIPNRISCVLQPVATSHEEAGGEGKRRIASAEVRGDYLRSAECQGGQFVEVTRP